MSAFSAQWHTQKKTTCSQHTFVSQAKENFDLTTKTDLGQRKAVNEGLCCLVKVFVLVVQIAALLLGTQVCWQNKNIQNVFENF